MLTSGPRPRGTSQRFCQRSSAMHSSQDHHAIPPVARPDMSIVERSLVLPSRARSIAERATWPDWLQAKELQLFVKL
ncbi:hypothetical protein E4U41_004748 [Claviceps citrina]|nr:hypothetical protein E4U41_004748 [Claviceps citrina]